MTEKKEKQEEKKGLRFGVIGLGQCGSNIANEFARQGYKAIAINTAEADLEKLDCIPEYNRVLAPVGGVQGAGKDPEIGALAYEQHKERIDGSISQILCDNQDVIFVCAGLGGGTGSGMAIPLVEELVSAGLNVNMIITLPSNRESTKAKSVALEAYEKLSRLEGLFNIFVIDNEKSPVDVPISVKNKFASLNNNIVSKLDTVNEFTTKPSKQAFDASDYRQLLSTTGTSAIFKLDIEDVADLKNPEYLPSLLVNAYADSIFANTDHANPVGIGHIFYLPAGSESCLLDSSIDRMIETFGTHYESYPGLYDKVDKAEKSGEGRAAVAYIILTGLSLPKERLMAMMRMVEDAENALNKTAEDREKDVFSMGHRDSKNKFSKFKPNSAAPGKTAGSGSYMGILRKTN